MNVNNFILLAVYGFVSAKEPRFVCACGRNHESCQRGEGREQGAPLSTLGAADLGGL